MYCWLKQMRWILINNSNIIQGHNRELIYRIQFLFIVRLFCSKTKTLKLNMMVMILKLYGIGFWGWDRSCQKSLKIAKHRIFDWNVKAMLFQCFIRAYGLTFFLYLYFTRVRIKILIHEYLAESIFQGFLCYAYTFFFFNIIII